MASSPEVSKEIVPPPLPPPRAPAACHYNAGLCSTLDSALFALLRFRCPAAGRLHACRRLPHQSTSSEPHRDQTKTSGLGEYIRDWIIGSTRRQGCCCNHGLPAWSHHHEAIIIGKTFLDIERFGSSLPKAFSRDCSQRYPGVARE